MAPTDTLLSDLGIEANMWRDLVWNYKRYFGGSSCAGSPDSMAEHAESIGKRFHQGLRALMEEVLLGVMYDLPGRSDVGKVVIDDAVVLDKVNPTLVLRKEMARTTRPRRAAS